MNKPNKPTARMNFNNVLAVLIVLGTLTLWGLDWSLWRTLEPPRRDPGRPGGDLDPRDPVLLPQGAQKRRRPPREALMAPREPCGFTLCGFCGRWNPYWGDVMDEPTLIHMLREHCPRCPESPELGTRRSTKDTLGVFMSP